MNDNLSSKPEPYSAAALLAAMRLHPELSQIFFLTGHQIDPDQHATPGAAVSENSEDLVPVPPRVLGGLDRSAGPPRPGAAGRPLAMPRAPRQHVRFATPAVEPLLQPQTEQRPAIAIISADPTTGLMRPVQYENADRPTQIDVLSSLLVKTAVALAAQTEVQYNIIRVHYYCLLISMTQLVEYERRLI